MSNEEYFRCNDCGRLFKHQDGCFNYPSGRRCTDCGDLVNDYLKMAEKLLEIYKDKTGYKGISIDHGY